MKKFRTYQPDQLMLLPPNLQDWLPAQHLARYISDVVDHVLDLTEILQAYDELKGGQPPYHPAMMVKLILFGYCVGVKSSREIEKATWESIPFRVLAANQHPDHSAISMFRKRHLNALGKLFHQSLYFAVKEGMVSLEVVAVDGTKIEANAARGKTLTIDGVADREKKLQQVVDEILAEAEEIDAEEDRKYGSKSLLDVVKYQGNIERLKELKKQMEEEQAEAEREKESRKKKPTAASKAKQKRERSVNGRKVAQRKPPKLKSRTSCAAT